MSVRVLTVLLALGLAPAAPGQGLLEGVLGNVDVLSGALANQDALLGTIDEAQERRLGETAGAVLLGAAPPVADDEAQRYVNAVGRWLALHTERPQLGWRFAILDADTVNAFAAPGGYVFITRGLFMALGSEHELAGVLAHEMGHVLERHHVEALVEGARFELLTEIGKRAADQQGLLIDALVDGMKDLYASGLSHADEHEADSIGIAIAERAGYDPRGLATTLTTLQALSAGDERLTFFASTHPPLAERLSRLNATLAARPVVVRPDTVASLAAVQARLEQ